MNSEIMSDVGGKEDKGEESSKEDGKTESKGSEVQGAPAQQSLNMDILLVELDKRFAKQESRLSETFNTSFEFLHETIRQLKEENTALKARLECVEERSEKQERKLLYLQREIEQVKEHTVKNEQYSRRNNLKIFGLKEETNEDTAEAVVKMVKDKMKITMSKDDIEVAHRIPTRGGTKPAIVKLRDTSTKFSLLKSRKSLKGSGITIAEDVTQSVLDQLKKITESENTKEAWIWMGKIYVRDNADNVHKYAIGDTIPVYFMSK